MELKRAHTAAAEGYWALVEALVIVDTLLDVDSLLSKAACTPPEDTGFVLPWVGPESMAS
jgi:hypothetical protein